MLRVDTFDAAAVDHAAFFLPKSLLAQALESFVLERQMRSGATFVIEQFCAALIADAPALALAQVDRLLNCGVGVETFYDAYLPHAAARLGDMWMDDTLSFAGVSLGMARLTEVFRRLSPMYLKDRAASAHHRRALFALAPGETHSFGVVMAADRFQRRGWSVRVELGTDAEALARIARSQDFDLIGISAGARRTVPVVARSIETLRPALRPGTPIMIGGYLPTIEPEVAALVGADLASSDAAHALALIESSY